MSKNLLLELIVLTFVNRNSFLEMRFLTGRIDLLWGYHHEIPICCLDCPAVWMDVAG